MTFREEYKGYRLTIWQAGIHGFTGTARPWTENPYEHVPADAELQTAYFCGKGSKAHCIGALKKLVDTKIGLT